MDDGSILGTSDGLIGGVALAVTDGLELGIIEVVIEGTILGSDNGVELCLSLDINN